MSGAGDDGATPLLDALEPIRAALLARARADATRLQARAEADAALIMERARADSEAIIAEARTRGEREAAQLLDAERARSRRTRRAAELAAQRAAYAALRERTARVLQQMCAGPDRDRVTRRMSAAVARVLGPDAVVAPAPGGGVVGRAAGRFADCSIDALADRAVEQLGAEAERLWQP